ncbi:uroporphyrinogen-III synthase [Arthrobacter mobilis]|uniref:Uroporphyrinogen-III synthase n=1 Tax=Arthrobacter mobilis TaxID=2724944 RepID=A0A7X6K312_9MICC|nr:uroporphyrinogen-III synthase [Arthrobacter mobilis]NKX53782.1 uroporphyrinogen-III synthase [Arthrobacter mobilis]
MVPDLPPRMSPAAPPLAGLVVVLPRSADRAAGMADELAARGAVPRLMPLIDFEEPESPRELDEALVLLGRGGFEWLVVTSITTVRALKQRAALLGTSLAELTRGTKLAAVGSASARVLAAEGLDVSLVPEASMDAVGLVAAWPERTTPAQSVPAQDGTGKVLLPQADIAAATLADGLAAKGWQVRPVVAYRTVDYPARPDRRLTAVLAAASAGSPGADSAGTAGAAEISVADFNRAAADGGIGAVVLTSPSLVRRLHAVAPGLPAGVLLVAIGNSTAREAARLELRIAAVAAAPTPAGVADALAAALAAAPGNAVSGHP